MNLTVTRPLTRPSLLRCLSAAFYEVFILFGILFLSNYLFLALSQTTLIDLKQGGIRLWLYQLYYLLFIPAIYFTWSWSHGRRTLAQKTWGLRIVNADGSDLSQSKTLLRYLMAYISLFLGLSGFFYALFNSNRLFLHDYLLNTRIILDTQGSAYGDNKQLND